MSAAQKAAREIVSALVDAWNAHDAKAFAAVFSPEAEFTNVFGMKADGRDAVERFHAPIFATMFRHSRLQSNAVASRQLRPDVATVDVRWSMSGARDPLGNEWPDRHGLISLVVAEREGEWLIETMHNMELADGAAAEAQRSLQENASA